MPIKMRKINKFFGPVQVLFDVDFTLEDNEFHALLGENGAGKSTLVKILTGIEDRTSGSIEINGEEVVFKSILDAEKRGIYIVNQELNLFPEMSVLDNLFMCKERSQKGWIQFSKQRQLAQEVFERLELNIDLDAPVRDYSVGVQQLIEIAKSLLEDAQVIILDEPTSALSSREITILFEVLKKLKKQGKSIVYISHRLPEIFELCEAITILRDGKFVLKEAIQKMNFQTVVKSMVGYEMGELIPPRPNITAGRTLLEAKNLTRQNEFEAISFHVKAGEIIGFAGLIGSGRTELMNALFGVTSLDAGTIEVEGNPVNIKSVSDAKELGMGYVTENRKEEGLFLNDSIHQNILYNVLKDVNEWGIIDDKKVQTMVSEYMHHVQVKAVSSQQLLSQLSGGNQQKVVLAKWLATHPKILILDEPTRGIDVKSKKQIYELIFELKKQNYGVIIVSSELVEILGVSDRIYILREGHLMKVLDNQSITDEDVMVHMMGGAQYASQQTTK